MTKLELIAKCLGNAEIADWYVNEHGVKFYDMTNASLRTFGSGGHGDIADRIILDGLEAGVITEDEYETAVG